MRKTRMKNLSSAREKAHIYELPRKKAHIYELQSEAQFAVMLVSGRYMFEWDNQTRAYLDKRFKMAIYRSRFNLGWRVTGTPPEFKRPRFETPQEALEFLVCNYCPLGREGTNTNE